MRNGDVTGGVEAYDWLFDLNPFTCGTCKSRFDELENDAKNRKLSKSQGKADMGKTSESSKGGKSQGKEKGGTPDHLFQTNREKKRQKPNNVNNCKLLVVEVRLTTTSQSIQSVWFVIVTDYLLVVYLVPSQQKEERKKKQNNPNPAPSPTSVPTTHDAYGTYACICTAYY